MIEDPMRPRVLYKHRYFCNTESQFKYQWSENVPTTCVSDSNHTIDLSSLAIVDSVSENSTSIRNWNVDPYGDVRVTQKTPVIEIKSCFGLSVLRDIATKVGTGTVTNTPGQSEYVLSVTANNDLAALTSAERGRYVSGFGAEVGIAVRIPGLATNQTARWGLFDGNDGFYYKMTGSNFSLVISRNGVVTEIQREAWNGDKMDGTGPSGLTINPADGKIYNILFSWYGYGIIDFRVVSVDRITLQQRYISLHRYWPQGQTSIQNPNLPLYASIQNPSSGSSPGVIYVAGRQYSIVGDYTPLRRINSAYRTDFAINSTTNFLPVISVRRKTGYLGNAVKISSADLISTTQQIIQIRVNGSLTGPTTWVNINEQVATETAMEMDISSTGITGGYIIWSGIVAQDKSSLQQIEHLLYDLTEYYTLTLCSKAVGFTNGSLSASLRWTEEW